VCGISDTSGCIAPWRRQCRAQRWAPNVAEGFRKASTHLAQGDVRESIRELQYYRERLLRPF